MQVHVELSMEIGHDELTLCQYGHTGKLYGMSVFVGDLSLKCECLG